MRVGLRWLLQGLTLLFSQADRRRRQEATAALEQRLKELEESCVEQKRIFASRETQLGAMAQAHGLTELLETTDKPPQTKDDHPRDISVIDLLEALEAKREELRNLEEEGRAAAHRGQNSTTVKTHPAAGQDGAAGTEGTEAMSPDPFQAAV